MSNQEKLCRGNAGSTILCPTKRNYAEEMQEASFCVQPRETTQRKCRKHHSVFNQEKLRRGNAGSIILCPTMQRKCRKHHSVSNQEKLHRGNAGNIILCPTKRNYAEEMQEAPFCVQPRETMQRKCRKHHSVSNQEKLHRGNAGSFILCPTMQRKCNKHPSVSNQEKLRRGNAGNIILCPKKRNHADEMQEASFCVQPREAMQRKCRKHHSVSNQEKLRRGNAGSIILCPTKRSYAEEMQEASFCVQPREAMQRKCRKHHSVSNQEKLRRGNAGSIILCTTKRSYAEEMQEASFCVQSRETTQRKCWKHHSVSNQEKLRRGNAGSIILCPTKRSYAEEMQEASFCVQQRETTQLRSHHVNTITAKSCYENNLIYELSAGNTSNISNIYKYIKNIRGSHDIPDPLFHDSKAVTSDLDKSNMFNQFFYSVFAHINFELSATNTPSAKGPTLSYITISEEDVYLTLCSLGSSKTTGPDGIGPNILKSFALALCLPLHHLFIKSLKQHYISRDWCVHRITPIFKSGDKTSVGNCWPISLLRSYSRVFERIILIIISDFIEKSIVASQFGFLKSHSTLLQLILYSSGISIIP